ncbi:hypothetical protein BDV38DRAFT_287324 [Aspergillus pseudotamarii]|uniref:Xylanolytic transcriptional activator regulatory domain-containing protein n=1 Tax=Aspergillus pseudotamarii TaxID=132259 RepID=A0A5N6SG50_ASPPS|nr:uncharacterized protein BDV38DRAFT_287324 [Aspergillus pseudotamarii]KAE8132849.1 hypothetical protein BDV38DRAFT_287324 [Aspergillus pseudotamarii]
MRLVSAILIPRRKSTWGRLHRTVCNDEVRLGLSYQRSGIGQHTSGADGVPWKSRTRRNAHITSSQQQAAQLEARISLVESILCDTLTNDLSTGYGASQGQLMIGVELQCSPSGLLASPGKGRLPGLQHGWLDSKSASIIPDAQQFVRSVLGHSANLEALFRPCTPWKYYTPEYGSLETPKPTFLELPDVCIINDYVAAYHSSSVHFILPVIDRDLFQSTVSLAFSTSFTSGAWSARACVWAFLCLSSIWNFPVAHRPLADATVLARKVESYVPRILHEETLDGLQALIMLMAFHSFSGNLQTGLYIDSLISRLLYKFGVHVHRPQGSALGPFPHAKVSSQVDCHLRSLFWTAYVIDKELSIRMGQPAAIQDEACDLTIPPGYGDLLSSLPLFRGQGQTEPAGYLYLTDLRLIQIKARIYDAIYSQPAISKADADLFKVIRDLDEELEMWRLSLPAQYRPSLSSANQQVTNITPPFIVHAINLQMDYYHCVTMIHRACARSKVWQSSSPTVPQGILTSFKLAVESSRTCLNLLKALLPRLPEGTFWCFVFHPLSACLTIFGNILLFPVNSDTAQDFAQLESAASLIRALPMSPKQTYKHGLVEFITKLSERARQASRESGLSFVTTHGRVSGFSP